MTGSIRTLLLLCAAAVVGCGDDDDPTEPTPSPPSYTLYTCTGEYPYEQLRQWRFRLREVSTVDAVHGMSMNAAEGCLKVNLSSASARPALEARLNEIGIPLDAVMISIGPPGWPR